MMMYVIKRLLQLIPILLGITFLSFAMMHIAGSDAVVQKYDRAGIAVAAEVVAAERAQLGLDRPFLAQYLVWLGNLLHGNMGVSFMTGRDVFATFMDKLPATLLLTASSVLVTIAVSVPLGIAAAVRRNSPADYVIRFFSFCGNSMPNFFWPWCCCICLPSRFPCSQSFPRGKAWSIWRCRRRRWLLRCPLSICGKCGRLCWKQWARTMCWVRNREAFPFLDAAAQHPAGFLRYDPDIAGSFHRQSAGRDGHCRIYFHVGRRGKASRRRDLRPGLSHDSGLCRMDGPHLRRRQFAD